MAAEVKCPVCGLTQVFGLSCKACGTPLERHDETQDDESTLRRKLEE
jgi:hypothetical protein